MYQAHGTYYTEEHSVSFGEVITQNSQKVFSVYANTWDDWHLIPSSRPYIEQAVPDTKYIEMPGMDGQLDYTEYFGNTTKYGQRNGTLNFIIDNDHEAVETVREKMAQTLHGKYLKMVLMDDPDYYYEGFFKVGNVEPGSDHSSISISYQLNPYKKSIDGNTSKL